MSPISHAISGLSQILGFKSYLVMIIKTIGNNKFTGKAAKN
ncbi:hypothetical protein [Rickettsia endosymbiont of Polydrusus tereticollis]